MTGYVILRHTKLKSYGEIGGSLDHTYRLIDTPNSDSSRLNLNEHDFNKKTDVVQSIKNRVNLLEFTLFENFIWQVQLQLH